MTGLQRLQYVATLIKDAKDIMPASYGIDIAHGEISDDMHGSFDLILEKIKEEYGVITFEQVNRTSDDEDGTMRHETDYYINTLTGFDEFYSQLMRDNQNAPKPSSRTNMETITYDEKHAKVSYGSREVLLSPTSSMQAFLFQQIYKANGEPIDSDTIITDYAFVMHNEELGGRSFKDARIRVNNKLLDTFGFEDAIQYKDERFWLNPELIMADSRHSR